MIWSMSQPTELALRPHHGYKSWTATWWDEQGHHRTKRFGREGVVTKAQAQAAFRTWLSTEYASKAYVRNPDDPKGYTVAILAEAYKVVAKGMFVKNGKPTSHYPSVVLAMDALSAMYGSLPASALDNPKVAKLREAMIVTEAGDILTVKTVNGRLSIIKIALKWARERELISAETLADVLAVNPLKVGRTTAKASRKIKPVASSIVKLTQEKLPQTLRDMVDLQLLTGMRPGEVCSMRACDVERNKAGWVYRPTSHKTEHKDKVRAVSIGPKAQAILAPRIDACRKPTDFLFTPAAAMTERRGDAAAVHPHYAESYNNQSYRKAIIHACNAVRKDHPSHPNWHPHQLRHNFATKVGASFDDQSVADSLGHSGMDMVKVYRDQTNKRAAKVAKAVG